MIRQLNETFTIELTKLEKWCQISGAHSGYYEENLQKLTSVLLPDYMAHHPKKQSSIKVACDQLIYKPSGPLIVAFVGLIKSSQTVSLLCKQIINFTFQTLLLFQKSSCLSQEAYMTHRIFMAYSLQVAYTLSLSTCYNRCTSNRFAQLLRVFVSRRRLTCC